MRIATLRRRLALEREEVSGDEAGGATRVWTPAGAAFAAVEAVRRGEQVERERNVGAVTHKVTVRWRADVARNVRFVDGAVRYRVLATEADDARRWLTCLCAEEQS